MKIVAISDMHGSHRKLKLPKGDVLVIAGDFTKHGTLENVIDLNDWISGLGYLHVLVVPGNHDGCFEDDRRDGAIRLLCDNIHCPDSKIHYLEMDGVTINGFDIYGMPWMPYYMNWSFMLPRRGRELSAKVNSIPNKTDILITHSPPYGTLDESKMYDVKMGCEILARRVQELPSLKCHIFGHNHASYGSKGIFHNVSVVNEDYELVREPTVIEVQL